MAELFIFDIVRRRAIRRERVFRDRSNDLDSLNDTQLLARFRFPRRTILELTDLVGDLLQRPTSRSHSIPPYIQVMTTLKILAKGDYLSEVADVHGISIASASRVIHPVCDAICSWMDIRFPTLPAEQMEIKNRFYQIAGFPNVLGAIDGTLIPIMGMSGDDEPNYVCRKQFHAINVQAVCTADLRFTNIVVKWPGATHDAFILHHSNLAGLMETQRGWLLGDSGYPIKRWLMTPLLNTANQNEANYNRAHITTRNTIERSFGVMKARFRCLHKTGGSLQFVPCRGVKMIGACFRLHNKAIKDGLPLPEGLENIQLVNNNHTVDVDPNSEGSAVRRELINRF